MLHIKHKTKAPPLTQTEIKWLKQFDKILNQCPARFEFTTMGDPTLSIVDAHTANEIGIEIEDHEHINAGSVLTDVTFSNIVHSPSG